MARYYSDMVNCRTAVYRMYDAQERLLYVGISMSMEGRMTKHRRKPWFEDVADITVKWYPGREEAKAAEKVAIREENPIHNITRPTHVMWREIV